MEKRCEFCSAYYPTPSQGQGKGECHLNPPTPFPVQTMNAVQQPQLQVIMLNTTVTEDYWCEHFNERQLGLNLQQNA